MGKERRMDRKQMLKMRETGRGGREEGERKWGRKCWSLIQRAPETGSH